VEVDSKLEVLYYFDGVGYLLKESKVEFNDLEERWRNLLNYNEVAWRLK